MIKFNDPRLYLKGVGNVVLSDIDNGTILYQSDKFTTGQVSTSLELGEIRAGIGNPIVAMLPNNAGLSVEFTAADFSFWAKAVQSGATVSYGAPVPVCAGVTYVGGSGTISVDTSLGTPVANLGEKEPYCYIMEDSGDRLMSEGSTPYTVNPTTGEIAGFVAEEDKTYWVHWFVRKGTAAVAKIDTLMKPKTVHFMAQFPVYSNVTGNANSGTLQGNLYVIVPRLSLTPNASVNGDQSNADTTMISGQALPYGGRIGCDDCGSVGSDLAYYVYAPCNDANVISGLAVVGGVVSLAKSTSAQIPVRWVMPDNSLAIPTSYSEGFTYTPTGLPSGTTVSNSGLVTAGATAGDGEVEVKFVADGKTYTTVLNVEVTN